MFRKGKSIEVESRLATAKNYRGMNNVFCFVFFEVMKTAWDDGCTNL